MHQEIRQSLEDYLRGDDHPKGSGWKLSEEFHAHLGECAECSGELQALETQSQLLQSLRSPSEVEPRAGFYARVLERIEAQPASIWAVFLDRKFGFRLALASAALVALLGTYLVTSEPSGPEFASAPAVVLTDTPGTAGIQTAASVEQAEGVKQQRQRDAVLVDLASYHQ
jgi:hypothetical protein